MTLKESEKKKACIVYVVADHEGTALDASYTSIGNHLAHEGSCGICVYRQSDARSQDSRGLHAFFRGVGDCTSGMQLGAASHRCLVHASCADDTRRICYEMMQHIDIVDGDDVRVVNRMIHAWCEEDVQVVYLVMKESPLTLVMLDTVFQRLDAEVPGFYSHVFVCAVVERRGYNVHDLEQWERGNGDEEDGDILRVLRPPQSFMYLENRCINNDIDPHVVGTFVYRLPGSTRVDLVESLVDVRQVYRWGAHKCIAVERILYEVAYKIGCSMKYGA